MHRHFPQHEMLSNFPLRYNLLSHRCMNSKCMYRIYISTTLFSLWLALAEELQLGHPIQFKRLPEITTPLRFPSCKIIPCVTGRFSGASHVVALPGHPCPSSRGYIKSARSKAKGSWRESCVVVDPYGIALGVPPELLGSPRSDYCWGYEQPL